MTAIAFAIIAVLVILYYYKELPGVALGLTFSWAAYSALKKASTMPALISLVYETLPFALLGLAAIIYLDVNGIGALSVGAPREYAMLWLSGLVTLIPMALFGYAAQKTTLLVIGLTQYISPTMTLLLGVFVYGEPFDRVQFAAFVIIWTGLAIFTVGEVKKYRSQSK